MKNRFKDLPNIKINKNKISIVFIGTPSFSAEILDGLIKFCDSPTSPNFQNPTSSTDSEVINKPSFKIQAVLTAPERLVGRGQIPQFSPIYNVAQRNNLPILTPVKIDDEFIISHLSLLTSDLFIVVSFGKILPLNFLNIPRLGALNIHPSLLPKYRGASPIQAALLNGDKTTGVSLMLMDASMDHGPLIFTSQVDISDADNYLTLSKKLSKQSLELLLKTLPDFVADKITPTPQNDSKSSYTWKTSETKQMAYLDINELPDLEALDRKIRAFYPEPGAWTNWKGKIVKFLPGRLVQMEGKQPVKLENFLNGYPDFPIKSLI